MREENTGQTTVIYKLHDNTDIELEYFRDSDTMVIHRASGLRFLTPEQLNTLKLLVWE